MFDVADLLPAARQESGEYLRASLAVATEQRAMHAEDGRMVAADFYATVAAACAQALVEHRRLYIEAESGAVESLGVRVVGPVTCEPDTDDEAPDQSDDE